MVISKQQSLFNNEQISVAQTVLTTAESSVFNKGLSEGPKITAIQYQLLSCPLGTDIS